MINRILTSDFTPRELVCLHTHILTEAKRACSNKALFHQQEINTGHSSEYHIAQLKLYSEEFRKWVPIVRAAALRDQKREEAENAEFYAKC